MYSEKIMDEIVDKMDEFLENHTIHELLELVIAAVAKKEE